jgi:HSP20 family molecular chaperone IbpA
MSYAFAYPYVAYPDPLVDHPHPRTHQHQTYSQYLRHKTVRPEDNPNTPDLDFRDAIHSYLIEIEVPGIKKPEELNVTWTGQRALLVTGNVERPDYGDKENARVEEEQQVRHAGGVHLLVGERR